jgi:hypothetical protein
MRKERIYNCEHCKKDFITRKKNQKYCSYICSNNKLSIIRYDTIDKNTGENLHQLYSKKATEKNKKYWYKSDKFKELCKKNVINFKSLKSINKFNESILKRKNNIVNGLNQFQISTQKAIITKINKKIISDKKNDFELYKWLVWYYTKLNNLSELENYNNRGRAKKNTNNYHLDHRYSIINGYHNNVPPNIIGHLKNIHFIHYQENIKKGHKNYISLKELYEITNNKNEYSIDIKELYYEKKHSINLNNKIFQCAYCKITTNKGNYVRWHNEKCKLKNSDEVAA